MKRFFFKSAATLILVLCSVSCSKTGDEEYYLKYLYDNMTYPDEVMYGQEYWRANVRKAMEVREKMNWKIPEDLFLEYVLPPRADDEPLDNFRLSYADSLCAMVKDMTDDQAVMAINYWYHQQMIYTNNPVNASPECLLARGETDCRGFAQLAVAATRAIGIPARVVFANWSTCDGTHGWIEVWTGGQWHVIGSADPEIALDRNWLRTRATWCMALNTTHFNGKKENVLNLYTPTFKRNVQIIFPGGKPAKGAKVDFLIYNGGRLIPQFQEVADEKGRVCIETGTGDMIVFARSGQRFTFAVSSCEKKKTIVLDNSLEKTFAADFKLFPSRAAVPSLDVPDEVRSALKKRMEIIDKGHDSVRLRNDRLREYDFHQKVTESFDKSAVISTLMDISKSVHSYAELDNWIRNNIAIISGRNPLNIQLPIEAICSNRASDDYSLRLFSTAIGEILSLPTEEKAIPVALLDSEERKGTSIYSLSKDGTLEEISSILVPQGNYLAVSGERFADNHIEIHLETMIIAGGTPRRLSPPFKKWDFSESAEIIGHISTDCLNTETPGWMIVALLDDEEHFDQYYKETYLEFAQDRITTLKLGSEEYNSTASNLEKQFGKFEIPLFVLMDTDGNIYYKNNVIDNSTMDDVSQIIKRIH